MFRVHPPREVAEDISPEALNEINLNFFKAVSARDDIMLTQTNMNGDVCIRLAVGSLTTEEVHIKRAFEIVELEAESVIQSWLKTRLSA